MQSRYQRDLIAKGDYPALNNDLVKTFAFAVQMLIAYFLMVSQSKKIRV